MKQREKIILGLALIAVVYAIYVLFFAGSPKQADQNTEPGLEDAKTFAQDMTNRLGTNDVLTRDMYILVQATAEWKRDLFLRSGHSLTEIEDSEQAAGKMEEIQFTYTGYLEMKNKKLAVINGMEYEEGESLGLYGYWVKDISPTQITISSKEQNNMMVLTLQEDDSIHPETAAPMEDRQINKNPLLLKMPIPGNP